MYDHYPVAGRASITSVIKVQLKNTHRSGDATALGSDRKSGGGKLLAAINFRAIHSAILAFAITKQFATEFSNRNPVIAVLVPLTNKLPSK